MSNLSTVTRSYSIDDFAICISPSYVFILGAPYSLLFR